MDKVVCPHCDKTIMVDVSYVDEDTSAWDEESKQWIVGMHMGRYWHEKCWEAFKAEYNDHLDANDLNGKKEK